jgi:hypothetical protein
VAKRQRDLPVDLLVRLEEIPAHSLKFLMQKPLLHRSQPELYRCACILRDAEFTPDEAAAVIDARFADYYRAIPEREVSSAVRAAYVITRDELNPTVPKLNESLIGRLTANSGGKAAHLASTSPVAAPHELVTGKVLDLLYSGDPYLCLGVTKAVTEPSGLHRVPIAKTKRRSEFRPNESVYELIVPNPMTAPKGHTRDGRISERCLANSASFWTYQVIEFDRGTEDEQAALILHLAHLAAASQGRLRMVVHSGGKSLHAWFDVAAMQPDELERFRRYAAAIGADPAMFRSCQFARLPNAVRREKNTLQSIRYMTTA